MSLNINGITVHGLEWPWTVYPVIFFKVNQIRLIGFKIKINYLQVFGNLLFYILAGTQPLYDIVNSW